MHKPVLPWLAQAIFNKVSITQDGLLQMLDIQACSQPEQHLNIHSHGWSLSQLHYLFLFPLYKLILSSDLSPIQYTLSYHMIFTFYPPFSILCFLDTSSVTYCLFPILLYLFFGISCSSDIAITWVQLWGEHHIYIGSLYSVLTMIL